MPKNKAKLHTPLGEGRTIAKSTPKGRSTTKFGEIVVVGRRPSKALVKEHVKVSTEALERVGKTLTKPGVKLRTRKDVPLYSIAKNEPNVLVRRLNGRKERVRLVNGVFEVVD